ncbi:hypothetical protein M0R45_008472 [Rubus argutus]|uniref:Uncharacterized protein n=1 Tax=Rubus argutus TaxID=59490 RepID=A0AAW1Y3R3_RUBAR
MAGLQFNHVTFTAAPPHHYLNHIITASISITTISSSINIPANTNTTTIPISQLLSPLPSYPVHEPVLMINSLTTEASICRQARCLLSLPLFQSAPLDASLSLKATAKDLSSAAAAVHQSRQARRRPRRALITLF